MDEPSDNSPNPSPLAGAPRRFARRLLAIGENRIELLMVEVQEEREHLLHLIFIGLFAAALGLLALMAFTAAVVVLLWTSAPVLALVGLGILYGGSALLLYRRLNFHQDNWQPLSATLEQLKKDRACLEKSLA